MLWLIAVDNLLATHVQWRTDNGTIWLCFFVSMISLKGFVNKEKQKHKTLGASAGNANGKIVYDMV